MLWVACAGAPGHQAATTPDATARDLPQVLLVRLPDCCATAPQIQLAHQLQLQLSRSTDLSVAEPQPRPPDSATSAKQRLTRALQRARTLYIGMHMRAALKELQAAWRLVRQRQARGAKAEQLALLQAYMAAVHDAMGNKVGRDRHSAAAMRFFPQLALNDDIFGPAVQRALQRAKEARVPVQVTVNSQPVGASVFWNGTAVGKTPVTLRDQAKGAHLLRLEHPLYSPWAGEINLATRVELEPTLPRASPEHVARAVAEDPDLATEAVRLLELRALLLLKRHPDGGLELTAYDGASGPRARRITDTTTANQVSRTLKAEIDRAPPPTTRLAAASRPSAAASPTRNAAASGWTDHVRRYWWAYAIAGGAAIAAGIALPLALQDDPQQRGFLLTVP